MVNINSLKASDGTGNAAVATIQSVRAPLATTIVVDTVENINSVFHGTMGTPHTFVDPVTSETITVISEATAVDFQGHVDGGNLEIDTIAPGYTDGGSQVNDIVIIKPTSQWADELVEWGTAEHNQDGTHSDITAATIVVADGGTLDVDTINEATAANGVAIDGMTIKDGGIADTNGNEAVKIGTTASAVNEVTVTNAATSGTPTISATGDDTNVHLSLAAKGNGLVKTSVLRQDNTTNTYQLGNTVTLSGWGVISAGAASAVSEVVSFGVTFAAAPIVVLCSGGDHASSTTYGSGGPNRKRNFGNAHSVTTTQFTAYMATQDGSNWTSGDKVFYQWFAIGELA